MPSHLLEGVVIPLLTPMDRPGHVVLEPVHDYLAALTSSGIPTVMPLGGNGEGPSIERAAAAEYVAHVVREWRALSDGRVLGGVISTDTREALARAEDLVDSGVDALVVSPPIYFRHTTEEIAAHFAAFAGVGVPIIAYDNRKYSGNPVGIAVARHLMEMAHVIGIKDSSADLDNLIDIVTLARTMRPEFAVNSGDERRMLAALRAGATGVTPGTGNFAPTLVHMLWRAFVDGADGPAEVADELAAALAEVHAIRPGIPTAKGILALRGIIPVHASLPFAAWSADEAQAVRAFLKPFASHLISRSTP